MPPLLLLASGAAMGQAAQMAIGLGVGMRSLLLASELGLVLPSLLFLGVFRIPLRRGLALLPLSGTGALLATLAGGSLWLLSLGLMGLQTLIWPPSEAFLEIFRRLHLALQPTGPADALASIFAIALVPALCEEVVFRGVMLPAFARRLGVVAAVLLSASFFSLLHIDVSATGMAFHRIPFTFTVGLALGALRVMTGSLLAPVLAHAALNTITFLTVLLSGAASAAMDDPGAVWALVLLILGTSLTVGLMRPLRALREAREKPTVEG